VSSRHAYVYGSNASWLKTAALKKRHLLGGRVRVRVRVRVRARERVRVRMRVRARARNERLP
jgi:hypothetical protein